ncbi:hypothetical protein [Bacteroides eggerthii]|jgi:hypothetical protein|uniref:hypothetical protein n=1 Tax=Bacteroides eggerthii TaxID=28111 RepID=UPI000E4977DD|nr:hypothetical protein [Bacteroides eggerthii]RHJ38618.1 hypothetical protein DW130_12120 [Bacteroides eggerthii]
MDRTGFSEVEAIDFDATLPTSPFPQLEHDTIMRRFRMSLQPYRGFYLYNKGRYEYFQIDNEEYRLEFTGKDSIRYVVI